MHTETCSCEQAMPPPAQRMGPMRSPPPRVSRAAGDDAAPGVDDTGVAPPEPSPGSVHTFITTRTGQVLHPMRAALS